MQQCVGSSIFVVFLCCRCVWVVRAAVCVFVVSPVLFSFCLHLCGVRSCCCVVFVFAPVLWFPVWCRCVVCSRCSARCCRWVGFVVASVCVLLLQLRGVFCRICVAFWWAVWSLLLHLCFFVGLCEVCRCCVVFVVRSVCCEFHRCCFSLLPLRVGCSCGCVVV